MSAKSVDQVFNGFCNMFYPMYNRSDNFHNSSARALLLLGCTSVQKCDQIVSQLKTDYGQLTAKKPNWCPEQQKVLQRSSAAAS